VGLDDMVRRRLQTLPAEAQRLLAMLSVAAAPLDRGVVLEAAGLAPDPDLALALESRRLLRPVASETRGRLEIYHDRIREAIDRGLTAQARKACHADIASALERHGIRDPALLFTHHAGAGHRASAARYAFEAGEQAERQLAFDAAARFYRAALDQDRSALDLGRTLSRLAEALANAGHGPQAAAAFEGASAETTGEEALVLLQRAAEQYLVCGRREEGKRLLVPLLASQGVRFPATSPGAIAATLWRLPLLALRYLLPGARTQSALGTRADACARAARGLLFIDPPRAAYFAVATLTDALRGGDPRRIGQALCLVGGALAPLGGPALAWARAMLARADRIAAEVKDPHLDAMSIISGGQLDFIEGRFESMLERCDRGARLLAERCRGVRWDCDVAQMGALRALEELGRVEELRRRLPRLLEEAAAYDDLYAEVTFRLYDAFWSISRGEVQRAREQARDVLERWGREAFEMQHLYELRIQAFCDVYGGAPEAAWARLRAAWPRLERSGLLAHRMLCSDAFQLRARLALAAGQRVEREVERAARRLERMGRPDALGASCLLRAASADHAGDSARSLALLSKAETFYANASMALHVAYAQRRRGELLAGDEGDALIWRADRTLAAAGIEDPQRWLELQAPGFRSVRA
jgi:hypothetical protein